MSLLKKLSFHSAEYQHIHRGQWKEKVGGKGAQATGLTRAWLRALRTWQALQRHLTIWGSFTRSGLRQESVHQEPPLTKCLKELKAATEAPWASSSSWPQAPHRLHASPYWCSHLCKRCPSHVLSAYRRTYFSEGWHFSVIFSWSHIIFNVFVGFSWAVSHNHQDQTNSLEIFDSLFKLNYWN